MGHRHSIFSSIEILQSSIESEEPYLTLPVRSLSGITLGATLFLNPRYDYGKEFAPHEDEQLLSIGISHALSTRVVETETQVLLDQPAEHPSQMILFSYSAIS